VTKYYIAGHRGMVGSAITRQLEAAGETNIVTRTHAELDLTDQLAVRDFMQAERPDVVILAAAKVGGIYANNTYPADFIYENLMIECNVIHQAFDAGVKKLLQLGSSCIYPKAVPQPMREDALLTGTLEPTNEPYAVAKIAGIKLCESYNRQHGVDYRSVMPTNLYGPGDNFHPDNSHVMPALIRRFHEAGHRRHHSRHETQNGRIVLRLSPIKNGGITSALPRTSKSRCSQAAFGQSNSTAAPVHARAKSASSFSNAVAISLISLSGAPNARATSRQAIVASATSAMMRSASPRSRR